MANLVLIANGQSGPVRYRKTPGSQSDSAGM